MKNGIEAMITDITATTAEAEDYIFGDSVGICEKAAVCGADKRLCGKDD